MSNLSDTGRPVLGRRFQQPDRRSCGAAVAVMAEALRNDGYARRLLAGGDDEFDREVRAMHRRITGPVDASGAIQTPRLRAIGTPPWALVRRVGRRTGRGRVVAARFRPGHARVGHDHQSRRRCRRPRLCRKPLATAPRGAGHRTPRRRGPRLRAELGPGRADHPRRVGRRPAVARRLA
ncbi:hypothetical protein [Nocardioides sp. B-3]|uniref:hypothetical protein n=1 Tax=Nocardioides sp. B-3 TaxID=2895565 RepID=UPI0021532F15|nr:hypothetical protein [Nocardioides sp. B-3]UUZ58029.1 hypothetical protein LP418_17120 [Nocardioides sp. B-3]